MISEDDILKCTFLIDDLNELIISAHSIFLKLFNNSEVKKLSGSNEEIEILFKLNNIHEKLIFKLKEIEKFNLSSPISESIKNIKRKCTMILQRLDLARKFLDDYRDKTEEN